MLCTFLAKIVSLSVHSRLVIVYSWKDCQVLFRRIRENAELKPEDKDRQNAEVGQVIQFSLNEADCRRAQILQHFAEPFDQTECHGTCDNCANPEGIVEEDMTPAAVNLIHLMRDAKQARLKVTRKMVIEAFRGKTKEGNLTKLRQFGIGKDIDLNRAERLYDHLVSLCVFMQVLETNASNFSNQYSQVCFLRLFP